MARRAYDVQLTLYDERGLAGDLLHDRHGALADERDRHWLGTHAVARDAARGVGGVDWIRLGTRDSRRRPPSQVGVGSTFTFTIPVRRSE